MRKKLAILCLYGLLFYPGLSFAPDPLRTSESYYPTQRVRDLADTLYQLSQEFKGVGDADISLGPLASKRLLDHLLTREDLKNGTIDVQIVARDPKRNAEVRAKMNYIQNKYRGLRVGFYNSPEERDAAAVFGQDSLRIYVPMKTSGLYTQLQGDSFRGKTYEELVANGVVTDPQRSYAEKTMKVANWDAFKKDPIRNALRIQNFHGGSVPKELSAQIAAEMRENPPKGAFNYESFGEIFDSVGWAGKLGELQRMGVFGQAPAEFQFGLSRIWPGTFAMLENQIPTTRIVPGRHPLNSRENAMTALLSEMRGFERTIFMMGWKSRDPITEGRIAEELERRPASCSSARKIP